MRQSRYVSSCLCLLSLAMLIATGYSPKAVAQTNATLPFNATPAEKAIYKALSKRQDFKTKRMPLLKLTKHLQKHFGITVQLDRTSLNDAGIALDTPISAELKNLSLRNTLKNILWDVELTYIIRDNVLLITTSEVADNSVMTRKYKVGDLVKAGRRNRKGGGQDFPQLIEILTSKIATESWDEVGGLGAIREVRPDMLVISQTHEVHEEISFFLTSLRKTPLCAKQKSGKVYPTIKVGESEEDKRIFKKLDLVGTSQFTDTPFIDVVKSISKDFQINIKLDTTAIDEAGIQTDTPVTVNLKNVKLHSALKLMLSDLELTYIVRNGVLLITTAEVADNDLTIVLYPVWDLFKKKHKGIDVDRLYQTITSGVALESWDDVGGLGSMSYFSQRALLVVSQTDEVHEKIGTFLAKMRASQ